MTHPPKPIGPFAIIAADTLAGAVCRLVDKHEISSRSPVGDALLEYASLRYGQADPIGGVRKRYEAILAGQVRDPSIVIVGNHGMRLHAPVVESWEELLRHHAAIVRGGAALAIASALVLYQDGHFFVVPDGMADRLARAVLGGNPSLTPPTRSDTVATPDTTQPYSEVHREIL